MIKVLERITAASDPVLAIVLAIVIGYVVWGFLIGRRERAR